MIPNGLRGLPTGRRYGMILTKRGSKAMTTTDALGRLIKAGDVCGFASRRRSQTSLETIVIRQVGASGIKADKLVKEWEHATATKIAGWTVRLVPTHTILRSEHLIITGLTELEAIELLKLRRER